MKRVLVILLCCGALLAARAGADEVVLSTGEALHGRVVQQSDTAVTLAHPILGTLELPRAQITQLHVASLDAPATQPATQFATTAPAEGPAGPEESALAEAVAPPAATQPSDVPEAPTVKAPQLAWWSGWKSRLEAGVTGQEGEHERLVLRSAFRSNRKTEETNTKTEATYYLAKTDGDTTQNEFTAAAGNDWLLPASPWFYFVESRYEYNDLADWNQRLGGFGGVGYTWFDAPKLHLDTRVGSGASKEFGGEDDEVKPEGLLGADVSRKIANGNQEVAATTRAFPDLSDVGEWRTRSSAEWRIKLTQWDGLSLKLGLEHEYETVARDDNRHNLKYFAALVYEF